MQSKSIAVLGMHRSGTSCLTCLLEDAGVWLGDVKKENPYNLKGNQESPAVMALHDEVLADNQASWNNPPAGQCRWGPDRIELLREIIFTYPKDRNWAIKDPRACFTIDGCLNELPEMRFVATFRHPTAAVASLRHRNASMSVEDGMLLWRRYNEQLLRLHRAYRFPVICFDMPPDGCLATVVRAFRELGLAFQVSRAGFFNNDLRNQSVDRDFRLPDGIADCYNRLKALAVGV
jgi:hypothetical protein